MSTAPPSPAQARLQDRADELRTLLQAGAAMAGERSTEVQDFKDFAAEETRAAVDEVTLAHAAQELEQVQQALRRIEDGSYGLCVDCGEPIDQRRLAALPATPSCTACQALRERQGPPHR